MGFSHRNILAPRALGLALTEINFFIGRQSCSYSNIQRPPCSYESNSKTMILRNSLLRQSQYFLPVITWGKGRLNRLQFGAHNRLVDSGCPENVGTEESLYVKGRGARYSKVDRFRGV